MTDDIETKTTLIPIEEVQRRLGGISRATVYRAIARGELKAGKLGSRTMFSEAEVERAARRAMEAEPA